MFTRAHTHIYTHILTHTHSLLTPVNRLPSNLFDFILLLDKLAYGPGEKIHCTRGAVSVGFLPHSGSTTVTDVRKTHVCETSSYTISHTKINNK